MSVTNINMAIEDSKEFGRSKILYSQKAEPPWTSSELYRMNPGTTPLTSSASPGFLAITLSETSPSLIIKIKAVNTETGEFKEKILTLATGIEKECLLGRHSSCDLVLNSAEVSRIHGRIWCQDGQCFYTDLGSTKGSQIDEEEVGINQIYLLEPNNLLRIGGFVLTIIKMSADDRTSQLTLPPRDVGDSSLNPS